MIRLQHETNRNVAEHLVQQLTKWGVKRIYGKGISICLYSGKYRRAYYEQ